MKKSTIVAIVICIVFFVLSLINLVNYFTAGNQRVSIYVPSNIYSNSSFTIQTVSKSIKDNETLETKSKVKLFDSNDKEVKGIKVNYEGDLTTIDVPNVSEGSYTIRASVSSKVGSDTIEKKIQINNKNAEDIIVNFDKGIYKPGDKVSFRALILAKKDNTPVSDKEINITIKDGNDNRVYNEIVKSSGYGIVSGNFQLADEVNSGTYELCVSTGSGEKKAYFIVNPYTLPKFEVNITTDKENYLLNDMAKITVNANYFFGETVKDAKVTLYVDGEKLKTLNTNTNGIAEFEYELKREKTYNIKAEVIDTSNYFIESSKTIYAANDKFKIEVYPEYGNVVKNTKNNIYVFTKTIYDEPIKTYITAISGSYRKQVVTDENGIGYFSLDIGNDSTCNIVIDAQNMSGDSISKVFNFNVEDKAYLVKTDKVKYTQGEDIGIEIKSVSETNKLYFYKGNKLIKALSTDSSETKVNLGEEYGLIDIYIQTPNNKSSYDYYGDYYYNRYNTSNLEFKRTVFVVPAKALNINIKTDKDEYKPGEEINISFDITNEGGNPENSALLVSMLDNSALAIADNDLSIDNIKLALSDIKLSEDLDLASLYSAILNDNNEAYLLTLLLKQGDKSIGLSSSTESFRNEKDQYLILTIIFASLFILILFIVLMNRFEKLNSAVSHICNYLVLTMSLDAIYSLWCNIFYSWDFSIIAFVVINIISLTIYITVISKKLFDIISLTSRQTIFTYALVFILIVLVGFFDINASIVLITILVFFLIVAIISKLNKKGKFKENGFLANLSNRLVVFVKYIAALVISIFATGIIEAIIAFVYYTLFGYGKLFSYNSSFEDIYSFICAILIVFAFVCLLYFLNYLFNIKKHHSPTNDNNKKTIVVSDLSVFAIVGVAIVVIFIISLGVMVYQQSTSVVSNSMNSLDSFSVQSQSSQSGTNSGGFHAITSVDPQESYGLSSTSSSIFDVGDIFNTDNGKKSDDRVDSNYQNEENDSYNDQSEHVRNLFLESMCFIPELIAENGKVDLGLQLSDNITTWTIQTVGNTKEGRIGYGSIDNVKVFKNFFVDFEFPANLVVDDKVSIPVTVYNYTDNAISVDLNIISSDWFTIEGSLNRTVQVEANTSNMIYIPLIVTQPGNNIFRIEARCNELQDIIEKTVNVSFNGYKVEKVVTSGVLDQDINDDILLLDSYIPNSAKVNVKIYSNSISQTVEGIENIFRMPTGCFEQVSSSLYPDIVALRYLKNNKIDNPELERKALEYISAGYQKLLSYEVDGKIGGFSLYGHSPAETVLTAYGLMEFKDLSTVYNVDEDLINRTTNYLYSSQKSDGSFNIKGYHVGGAGSRENTALNCYIIWALSEVNSKDSRLTKSISYIKNHMDETTDNYTLGLMACALANVNDNSAKGLLDRLVSNVIKEDDLYYVKSDITDYYGCYGRRQDTQATALLSLALSKLNYNATTNKNVINYIVSQKDNYGTWGSTQNTILCLKAINEFSEKANMPNQEIKVTFNGETKSYEINDNPVDVIQFTFNNVSKENKLNIDIKEGETLYMVTEEYYIPYENVDLSKNSLEVSLSGSLSASVNGIVSPVIRVINNGEKEIYNGMIVINIPQGFVVKEESLQKLQSENLIEKYEMNYRTINLYIRDFDVRNVLDLPITFRASYPVDVMGMSIRVYDYYNPDVEGVLLPQRIIVQ